MILVVLVFVSVIWLDRLFVGLVVFLIFVCGCWVGFGFGGWLSDCVDCCLIVIVWIWLCLLRLNLTWCFGVVCLGVFWLVVWLYCLVCHKV